jgi:hypothetical protein
MTGKQKFGLAFGLGLIGSAAYLWYKNQPPKFRILECNSQDKQVKWQYGRIVNVAHAGQNNTYSNGDSSDFYVNVGSIEQEGKVVGIRFNFLGKDNREPYFVYFE